MKKERIVAVIVLLVATTAAFLLGQSVGYQKGQDKAKTNNGDSGSYEECVAAGNPVSLSNPPQCHDAKGTHYGS